jgi:DNA-binding XRE family transcriptional regulator
MGDVEPVTIPLSRENRECRAGATFRALAIELIRLRKLRGWTQAATAKLAGISRSTYNALESGQATGVMVGTVRRLELALGVALFVVDAPSPDPVVYVVCRVCHSITISRSSRWAAPCPHPELSATV